MSSHHHFSRASLEYWMQQAIHMAEGAATTQEVPVGAVLVYQGQVVSKAGNESVQRHSPLAHAELLVLEQALAQLQQPQLQQSTLFVTLEPCPMCMGAILHAHVGQVVFGAYNLKWGSCGTVLDLCNAYTVAPACQIIGGIYEEACTQQLQAFFQGLRRV